MLVASTVPTNFLVPFRAAGLVLRCCRRLLLLLLVLLEFDLQYELLGCLVPVRHDAALASVNLAVGYAECDGLVGQRATTTYWKWLERC